MESRSNAIAAGVFVVVLTLGLIAAALWLTSDRINTSSYRIVSKIAVTGLHPKAAVRLRGVDVGHVDTIAFDPADPRTIHVAIAIDRDAPLTLGTYAQLGYQGVTGLAYVALDDDGSNPRRLPGDDPNAPAIPLRPSMLDDLAASGQALLRDASTALRRFDALLSDRNLASAAGALKGAEDASRQIAGLASDLRPAARTLQSLEEDARVSITRLGLLEGDLRSFTADAKGRLAAIDEMGRGARDFGAAARSLQAELVGETLPRLSTAIDDVSRASRSFDRVVQQIGAQPNSVVFGRTPPPPGPGEPGFDAAAAERR